ncbi:hypothetical protein ABZW67_22840 [Streptomyces rubiginosohelvolus]
MSTPCSLQPDLVVGEVVADGTGEQRREAKAKAEAEAEAEAEAVGDVGRHPASPHLERVDEEGE